MRAREVQLSEPALLRPPQIRELADAIGLRPSKGRGQNFIVDPNSIRRIVRIAECGNTDHIVEIGPGLGSLTLGLVATGAHVTAIEIDAALANQLPETIAQYAPDQKHQLHVIHADAMHLAATDVPVSPAAPNKLVANLPYNVSVPVLLHILETFKTIESGLVMVQSEVAHRLVAEPGSRIYGVPSLKARWYADSVLAGDVSRTVFWPAPNVDSSLVSWRRRQERGPAALRERVFALVDAAFAQRRKGLRAALASYFGSAGAAERRLSSAGIEPGTRGEQLGIDDFIALARTVADR